MATKPVSDFTWATDATYDADAAANKLEPPTVLREEGWERGEEPGAQHANHVLNAHGQWHGWAETELDDLDARFDVNGQVLYPTPINRVRVVPAEGGLPIRLQTTGGPAFAYFQSGAAPNQGYELKSIEDYARLVFPLNWYLPPESTLTRIRALVKPGAARTVMTSIPGDNGRLFAFLTSTLSSFIGVSVAHTGPLYADEDDGTTGLQILDTGVISYQISFKTGANPIYQIVCGVDAGTNRDALHAIEISYTDPGPRNI